MPAILFYTRRQFARFRSSLFSTRCAGSAVGRLGICKVGAIEKKNGDLEKNPLWQGFSSGLRSSVAPEDLEFRAQVCSPWMQDGRSFVFGQTNCLSSPNNLVSCG